MSFDWNLPSASEGEEEDLESWTRREGLLLHPEDEVTDGDSKKSDDSTSGRQQSFSMADLFGNQQDLDEDEDDDDDENVDWEDAPGAVLPLADNATKTSLRPVTIQLGVQNNITNNVNNKNRKRKVQRRQNFRFESLSSSLQALLCNLHNSHLLALTSRAVGLSAIASDPHVLAVALSLLPLQFDWMDELVTSRDDFEVRHHRQLPTLEHVQDFSSWFTAWVHGVEQRRARQRHANWAAGAPRRQQQQQRVSDSLTCISSSSDKDNKTRLLEFASYLSDTNELDPQLLAQNSTASNENDMNLSVYIPLLFLAMVRSMGWRARLVQSMDAMPLDLTVDHPIWIVQQGLPSFIHAAQLLTATKRHGTAKNIKKKSGISSSSSSRCTTASAVASAEVPNVGAVVGNASSTAAYNTEACGISWIEVLCQAADNPVMKTRAAAAENHDENKSRRAPKSRWIHVDPVNQLFNQPNRVEFLWKDHYSQQQQQQQQQFESSSLAASQKEQGLVSRKRRRSSVAKARSTNLLQQQQPLQHGQQHRRPVAYVLAVEHAAMMLLESNMTTSVSPLEHMRLTDVTPRYAASWIASLRLRGIVRDKQSLKKKRRANNNGSLHHDNLVLPTTINTPDTWWSKTLHSLNQCSKQCHVPPQEARGLKTFGKTSETAIRLDVREDDNDDDSNKKPAPMLHSQQILNPSDHMVHQDDEEEVKELQASAENEAIPTSKAGFQTHPLYIIPSVLGVSEVLAPDSKKRMCGVFKGELIYRRTDVSTALPARKWPYQGRKVMDGEKPVKKIKARKKPPDSKTFRALRTYGVGASNDGTSEAQYIAGQALENDDDNAGMEDLFAIWQTEPWSPKPVGPNDPIPVNEYKNVELELLNPGLVHVAVRGSAKVARNLSIPYAPCLLGFEGHGGNRTPTIEGIVVHQHNADLLREAMVEVRHFEAAAEHENRRKTILLKWKKLMVGLLTKERLEREYGDRTDD